jgi:NADPH:quinone reductase-like Zn-dependent oxidoreductase
VKAYIIEEAGKGPDALKKVELPVPKLGYGEVRIRVIAVSLNRRDVMVSRNEYGPSVKRNLVPFSDGAGEVGSAAMFEAMNRGISTNKIKPVIDRVFSFNEAQETFRTMESSSHLGKIVIRVG